MIIPVFSLPLQEVEDQLTTYFNKNKIYSRFEQTAFEEQVKTYFRSKHLFFEFKNQQEGFILYDENNYQGPHEDVLRAFHRSFLHNVFPLGTITLTKNRVAIKLYKTEDIKNFHKIRLRLLLA
jgi:hypothetical protein